MRGTIFFPALSAVMAGCGLGSHFFAYLYPYTELLFLGGGIILVALLGTLILSRWTFHFFGIACVVSILFLGTLLFGVWRGYHARDTTLLVHANESVAISGTVTNDPEISGTRQKVILRVDRLYESKKRTVVDEKILVSLPRFPKIAYGDEIRIEAVIKIPEPFDTEYGRTFAYDNYLRSQGIGYTAFVETSRTLGTDNGSFIIAQLIEVKHALFRSLSRVMHEPFGSIARAMVFGDKSGIPKKLTQQFQTTGLIHIMVLSGYNITIIAVALLSITKRFGKTFGIIISDVAIFAFLLMTGFTPTSTRAGIMGAIGLLALQSFRKSDPLRALFLAGAVMAIINPLVIIQSVSFQLSFVATLGLILLTPLFTFVRIPERFGLREIIGSTIATQVAVLPLLLGSIGMVSVTGLFVNILVVPLVPFIMLATVLASSIGILLPSPIVGIVPELLVRGIVWVVSIADRVDVLSFAQMSSGVGFLLGVGISAAIVFPLMLLRRKGLVY